MAAEQERDAALQMVRSTIDSSPIGIAVCLADGSFTQVNRALCAMLSRDSADLIGRTLQQCAHPADYHDDIASVLSGDLAEHESECRFERGDGTWIWGHCNLVRLRDDGGRPRACWCSSRTSPNVTVPTSNSPTPPHTIG